MALINCKECKGKVSDKALMCPHCGFGMSPTLENLLAANEQDRPPGGLQ